MTVNRNFKKTVRAYAATHNITYMQALGHFQSNAKPGARSPLLSDYLRDIVSDPSVFFGITAAGEPVNFDIGENLLVVGSTGSGKSTTISSILYQALHGSNGMTVPNTVFWIGEAKIGLHKFRNYPSVTRFVDTFSSPQQDYVSVANHLLIEAADEMNRRNRIISDKRAASISDIRDQSNRFPDIVLVLDEISDLLSNTASLALLEQITTQGNRAGVSIIASTANPSSLSEALIAQFTTKLVTSDIPDLSRFGVSHIASQGLYRGTLAQGRNVIEYDMFSLHGIVLAGWTVSPRRPYFLTESTEDFVEPLKDGVDFIESPHLMITGHNEDTRRGMIESIKDSVSGIDRVFIRDADLTELEEIKALMEAQQMILMDHDNIVGRAGMPESVAKGLELVTDEEYFGHPYRTLGRYVFILDIDGPISGQHAETLTYIIRRGRCNGVAFIISSSDPFYIEDDSLSHMMTVSTS